MTHNVSQERSKMTAMLWTAAFAFAFVLVPEMAFAGTKLSDVMRNITIGSNAFPKFVSVASYIAAVYLTMSGIFKTVDHVREPDRTHLMEPLKRFIVAGAFFSLPAVTAAVQGLIDTGSNIGALNLAGGAANGLDGVMMAFVRDIAPSGVKLVTVFSYCAAVAITAFGLNRLLRSAQEGPKGPTGFGTWMMFIVAAALFSLPTLMASMQGTLFGNSAIQAYTPLKANVGMTAAETARVTNVAHAAIGFMFFLGWVSFVRGIFIIREVADGGQASLMAGMTHLIGGGLAVNAGSFMKAVEKTFGL